jgi:hypothetical protein
LLWRAQFYRAEGGRARTAAVHARRRADIEEGVLEPSLQLARHITEVLDLLSVGVHHHHLLVAFDHAMFDPRVLRLFLRDDRVVDLLVPEGPGL